MKKLLSLIFIFTALLAVVMRCQPEDLTPTHSEDPLTSITARLSINGFDDLDFTGYPDANGKVVIEIPYFYPEASDNQTPSTVLTAAKMSAVLVNNAVITEPLTVMDISTEQTIKVIDQVKKERIYTVIGKIVKSNLCEITDFQIPALDLAGVIKGGEISLISIDDIPKTTASVTVSPHATISPDPATTEIDYNGTVTFTVTAFDGVTKKTYTVKKGVPDKIEQGIRDGSAKILFAKKLAEDIGITTINLTGGIAVSGDYLVINTRNEPLRVINRMTGEFVREVSLGDIQGGLKNFYITNDDAGHIFICNLSPQAGDFTIWKMKDIDSAPEVYITRTAGNAFGRKFSIQGNTDQDAVITAPCHTNPTIGFYRWVVRNGVLGNIEWGTATGAGPWNNNIDIVYSKPDPTSDYFLHGYSDNRLTWMDGSTNTVKAMLGAISVNYVPNAVDFIEFNNASILATNQVNSQTWGTADYIWLLDVSNPADFKGTLDAGNVPAVKWFTFGEYGPKAIGHAANGNATGDLGLWQSSNGYYLYLYFMFTNGYVVGVQFDCISM